MELKELIEKRDAVLKEMNELTGKLAGKDGKENRAFSPEELKKFNELKTEAEALNGTIKALDEKRELVDMAAATARPAGTPTEPEKPAETRSEEELQREKEQLEERAFVEYIRKGAPMDVETRADTNFTSEANGAVIPTSIARKIIEKVKEISPLYGIATHYNVGGTLTVPYYDESAGAITMGYANEFTDGEATAGSFKSISLQGFLARAITKVSKQLINNSAFDILGYIVGKVAEAAALWIDGELINGTTSKIEGLSGVTQVINAASAAITADELIDLQDAVPDRFQSSSIWLMSRKTRSAIRKLKDGDGNYLLNKDATSKWGYTLFGRSVYIADAVPDNTVFYGDFSGLAIKTSESVSIDVAREKYLEQHCYGIVAWLEMDAKIENAQKIAKLVIPASRTATTKA